MKSIGASKSNKLVKNTLIVGVGTVASKSIIFLMAPFFSRWLSTEAYGQFDLIITYVSLIIPICTIAISEATFRFLLEDIGEQKRSSIISSSMGILLVGFVVFTLMYYLLSLQFPKFVFNNLLLLLLFCQLFYTYMAQVVRGLKKLELYSLFSLLLVVFQTCLSTILLLVFNAGLAGIVIGYSIGYFISAVGLFIFTNTYRCLTWKQFKIREIRDLLGYSWPLIPNTISWWVVSVSDRIIIMNLVGLVANGIYAVANKVPSIVSIFFSVFHVSWVQTASESLSDKDYMQFCNSVYNKLFTFIVSVGCVLVSCNFIIYNWIFDAKYTQAYSYTPILILANVFACLSQFFGGIMIAKKNTKMNGITNLISAISNITINLLLVRSYGLYAASVSTLCAYLILFGLRKFITNSEVPVRLNRQNLFVFLIFCLVFAGVYINDSKINIFLLLFSSIFFIFVNKEVVMRIKKTLEAISK